jgi:two-component system, LytTR family, sensor histidine kinase AgrC
MKERINTRKVIITVIIFNILQLCIILGIVIFSIINREGMLIKFSSTGDSSLFYAVAAVVFTSSIFTIKNMYTIIFLNNEQDSLKATISQLESLNRALKSQRHDFMNHLQVVYSLMELQEYMEAQDYIDKVYKDIQKLNKALKTSNAAVNALLQAKLIFSETKGIDMSLNIESQLNELVIPSWEFCRVLGNLIDNAIYASGNVERDKYLKVNIYEDIKNYRFSVANNGPQISEEVLKRIFEPGFTTKGNSGEGMGLVITKDILRSYGGDITVKTDEIETVFEGWIPKP